MIRFDGKVQFRSSVRPSGPPGEAEVQRLNPQRVTQILEVTGWNSLEPGSLNLAVDDGVLDVLLEYTPALVEEGSSVNYPQKYQHIPTLRKAYYYYSGVASVGEKRHAVLVRRAFNPVPGRVELFASVKLTEYFGVTAGVQVVVEINESN